MKKKHSKLTTHVKQKPSKWLFRGDVNYTWGDPIGYQLIALALDADNEVKQSDINDRAEKACDHVLDEIGGHYTSFTTLHHNAKKFVAKGQYVRYQKIYKIKFTVLQRLEAEGTIRIYWPENIAELIKSHSKKKIRRKANEMKKRMEDNNEVLIEGQIPAKYVQKTN